MSEEKATEPGTGTPARRAPSAGTSRRRGTDKAGATGGPALPPERDDPFQAAPRVWPD
jgi:hypothetical protein